MRSMPQVSRLGDSAGWLGTVSTLDGSCGYRRMNGERLCERCGGATTQEGSFSSRKSSPKHRTGGPGALALGSAGRHTNEYDRNYDYT